MQKKGKGDAKGKRAKVTNQEMKEDAPAEIQLLRKGQPLWSRGERSRI